MNQDGTFNVERVDGAWSVRHADLYHRLLTLSWQGFVLFLIAVYFGANSIFACIYFLLGPQSLEYGASRAVPTHLGERFLDCFFFSAATFATIGYGTLVPHGLFANIVVTVEAFSGLFCIALLTGIVFARFSRPTAKVVFSDKVIIRKINGKPCLLVRFANLRTNQVAEAQVASPTPATKRRPRAISTASSIR